ncbi:hypothetical protein PV08_09101 [Exophiala spinifera]|uniref:NAD(P)-binding domain-containing protein n=1 Tax=Exophiala spinifera TaxID=91928 RepID=A0A0D2AYN0_9EURO|nr:uncharacterized protein PV08_09101 [Exophiala spinifera]KIW11828.1 hypothetical protein PV08_09101 [Exophiala spinifera]
MKVIITGGTGYIGQQVLSQCLQSPSIKSVVSLSRRDPGVRHEKLEIILHDDFSQCPPKILSKIQDAQACIYCLGTNIPVKPAELNRKINFEYALTTARIFAGFDHSSQPFHFVYLSGALPEKDTEKHLWFLAENRKMRGALENSLLQLDSEKHNLGFRVFIARPGFVQPRGAVVRTWLIDYVANAIVISDLAIAMVRLAVEGHERPLVENRELKDIARLR